MKNLAIFLSLFVCVTLASCDKHKDQVEPVSSNYQPLEFYSFFPPHAQAGDELILSVQNSNPQAHGTIVTIGTTDLEVIAVDDYTIIGKIPMNIPAGSYEITVRSNGDIITHSEKIVISNNRL